MLQENINFIVANLTLASHIVFVAFLALYFLKKDFRNWALGFINRNILKLVFGFSFSAMIGSLVYSNIAGFPPCELCWIQRIFMYPQVLLSFIALINKDKGIIPYLFPMTILGGLIAFYHSMSHYGLGEGMVSCTSALGDCGKLYVFEYNYITIPLMAFSIFVYLFTITLIYFKSAKERI